LGRNELRIQSALHPTILKNSWTIQQSFKFVRKKNSTLLTEN